MARNALLALITGSFVAVGCGGTGAPAGGSDRADIERLTAENAALRTQVAALAGSVDRIHRTVMPPPLSKEQQEFEDDGPELFWQRRFNRQNVDPSWGVATTHTLHEAVSRAVSAESIKAVECRSSLCRVELECREGSGRMAPGPRSASPRPPGEGCFPFGALRIPGDDRLNMGMQNTTAQPIAGGAFRHVVFLFREGQSMVPAAD